MAKINIELDTDNPADSRLFVRLIAAFKGPQDTAEVVELPVAVTTSDTPATQPDLPATPPTSEELPPPPPGQDDSHGPVEIDKDGVPWDDRIHSSSGGKTNAGFWKKQRNVDAKLHKSITAELKAAAGDPSPPPPAPPEPPAAEAPDSAWTWPDLLRATTAGFAAKVYTLEQRAAALEAVGVAEFPLLSTKPELYDAFAMALGLTKA